MQLFLMRGRPRRDRDADLAARLAAFRLQHDMTDAKIARDLAVHPSTICRSLKTGTFSKSLRLRLDNYLPPKRSTDITVRADHEIAIHFLQEFMQSLPKLKSALDILLDVRRDEE
jgi:IS30 family transposase